MQILSCVCVVSVVIDRCRRQKTLDSVDFTRVFTTALAHHSTVLKLRSLMIGTYMVV